MIFNRPDVTSRVFEKIREARPPKLYIAADGPRPDKPGEVELCELARKAAIDVDWDCEVKTLFRRRNLGCALACSSAISWFFQNEEEGIILEDDVLPHQDFFWFCDQMLEYYRHEPSICQITANNFQMGIKRGTASYYFSYFNHIWGWATWARAWKYYDHSLHGLQRFLAVDLPTIFPSKEAIKYFSDAFQATKKGTISSWAYRWTFSLLKQRGLTVTPNQNLAKNIGFGIDGTHCTSPSLWSCVEYSKIEDIIHPDEIHVNPDADSFTTKFVYLPGYRSAKSLFDEGCRRIDNGLAYSNIELIRMIRCMYGNHELIDRLEAITFKVLGHENK